MKKEWGIFALLRHRYVRIPFSVGRLEIVYAKEKRQ